MAATAGYSRGFEGSVGRKWGVTALREVVLMIIVPMLHDLKEARIAFRVQLVRRHSLALRTGKDHAGEGTLAGSFAFGVPRLPPKIASAASASIATASIINNVEMPTIN